MSLRISFQIMMTRRKVRMTKKRAKSKKTLKTLRMMSPLQKKKRTM